MKQISETEAQAPDTLAAVQRRVRQLEGELDNMQQTMQGLRRAAQTAEETLQSTQMQLLLYASDLHQSYIEERTRAGELDQAALELVLGLVQMVEARDLCTADHGWRVGRYMLGMAQVLGWSPEQQALAELGAQLHDIGKIGIDDSILRKPGGLTAEEYQTMQTHVTIGLHILENIQRLTAVLPYVAYHHERYDGSGYPFGLGGAAIPVEGRLLAVADAFDCVTSVRPYRPARPVAEGLRELDRHRGTQFDPQMVDAFQIAYAANLLPVAAPPQAESRGRKADSGLARAIRPPGAAVGRTFAAPRPPR